MQSYTKRSYPDVNYATLHLNIQISEKLFLKNVILNCYYLILQRQFCKNYHLVDQLYVKYIDLQLRTSIFSVDTQKVISKKFKKASIIDLCVTDVIRVC